MPQPCRLALALVSLVFAQAAALPSSSRAEGAEPSGDATEPEPEKEPGPRYPGLRTFGELSIILGVGTLWYWIERDRNVVDWDSGSWRQRFSREAYRFDNNSLGMNFLGHAMSGSAYYGIA